MAIPRETPMAILFNATPMAITIAVPRAIPAPTYFDSFFSFMSFV